MTFLSDCTVVEKLFNEELGLILEVAEADVSDIIQRYTAVNVPCSIIGQSLSQGLDSMVCTSGN